MCGRGRRRRPGAAAPSARTQPYLPCLTGGLPRLTATPTRSYVRCSLGGPSPTVPGGCPGPWPLSGDEFSVPGVDGIGGVVGIVPVIFSRIPGGKSSAGAAACRRCPRGASSSWGAYAAAHRCRIRQSPVVSCGGSTLWGISVGAIGWFRGSLRCVAGAPGPGDAVCAASHPFPVPQPILGPPLLGGGGPDAPGALCRGRPGRGARPPGE
jgi:hypothetical protein